MTSPPEAPPPGQQGAPSESPPRPDKRGGAFPAVVAIFGLMLGAVADFAGAFGVLGWVGIVGVGILAAAAYASTCSAPTPTPRPSGILACPGNAVVRWRSSRS